MFLNKIKEIKKLVKQWIKMILRALILTKLQLLKETFLLMFSNKYQIHKQIFVNAKNYKQEELCHQNLIHTTNNLYVV